MDLDEVRSFLTNSKMDVWTLIETAISVAASDYDSEFKCRRDAITERLYTPVFSRCQNCDHRRSDVNGGIEVKRGGSSSPESFHRPVDEAVEQTRRIRTIKERLEDPNQLSEYRHVVLLRNLAGMDISFKTLKETDIGRHVNQLRKHSSAEVRGLVKQLVRKWKDVVDEWVRLNTTGETASAPLAAPVADGDSPQQKNHREAPVTHLRPLSAPAFHVVTPNKQREVKQSIRDTDELAWATKRLHENYQEAQNAKRQRTVQVMDLRDIPQPKNTFFAKSRGAFQTKHTAESHEQNTGSLQLRRK